MIARLVVIVLAACVATGVVLGAAVLVLTDGREIEAEDVRREGGNYVATLEGGDTIVIPSVLVERVRLESTREQEAEKERARRERGQLAGRPIPEGPGGLTTDGPDVLAGEKVRPATREEQYAVFGEPVQFQKSIVDNTWHPSSDWTNDPENNNFAPSTWAKSIVDNEWEPESGWKGQGDVMQDSESSFQNSIIDNTWTPTDGFAR